jgi:hypothetical protein
MIKQAKDLKVGDCVYLGDRPGMHHSHKNRCCVVEVVSPIYNGIRGKNYGTWVNFKIKDDPLKERTGIMFDPDASISVYAFEA